VAIELCVPIYLDKAGRFPGTVGCVAIVRDRDPEQADYRAHNLMGILHGKGVMARIETIGAAKAVRTTGLPDDEVGRVRSQPPQDSTYRR
jgi:hypothetical protein